MLTSKKILLQTIHKSKSNICFMIIIGLEKVLGNELLYDWD